MTKFSKNFERDYQFYFKNIKKFIFCGTLKPKYKSIYDKNGKTAKECFYLIDSEGKNLPTKEPKLLDDLLVCKASVNFQIKQWAEGRADGTLLFYELLNDYRNEYDLPEWVIKAVEMQKIKIYEKNKNLPNWFQISVKQQKEKYNDKNYKFFN